MDRFWRLMGWFKELLEVVKEMSCAGVVREGVDCDSSRGQGYSKP